MARISNIDIPTFKRTDIALTYIYGIGRSNVITILKEAHVDGSKRVKNLTEDEINKLQKVIEQKFQIEGDLRRQVQNNIKRLKEISSYRGVRHARNLPVRGQRTRSNARTKRGKRLTIGAMKKDDRTKLTPTETKK